MDPETYQHPKQPHAEKPLVVYPTELTDPNPPKNAAYWKRRALKAEESNAELEEWKRENIIVRVDMNGLGSCAITVGEPLTRQEAIIAAGELLIKCTKEMLDTEETILRCHQALLLVANPELPRANGESDQDIAFTALNP